MAFTLKVEMTGSAFHDENDNFDPVAELARILTDVAQSVGEYYALNGTIRDTFGNPCGTFETVED